MSITEVENNHKQGGSSFFPIANRLLILCIIGLLGYVIVNYVSSPDQIDVDFSSQPTIEPEKVLASRSLADLKRKPFQVYEKRLQSRNFFQPLTNETKPQAVALKKALPALHKRIKLIGILVDKDSKAIVEDLKEKQTHFLSRGESLGTVLLEDIKEDKVIFMYNNELIEMAL